MAFSAVFSGHSIQATIVVLVAVFHGMFVVLKDGGGGLITDARLNPGYNEEAKQLHGEAQILHACNSDKMRLVTLLITVLKTDNSMKSEVNSHKERLDDIASNVKALMLHAAVPAMHKKLNDHIKKRGDMSVGIVEEYFEALKVDLKNFTKTPAEAVGITY